MAVELLNKISFVRIAREKAAAYERLVQSAQAQGIEPTSIGGIVGYTLPLDNVSYYDHAGVAKGSLNRYEDDRPLAHEDVEGQITIFKKRGGRYRARMTLSTITPLRGDPIPAETIVPESALAPHLHTIREIKHHPEDRYHAVYSRDRNGNAWSLHIKNPNSQQVSENGA